MPIDYGRGYAGPTAAGIDIAVDNPFHRLSRGATHVRAGRDADPMSGQFEGSADVKPNGIADIGEQNLPAPILYPEAAGPAQPAASSRTAPKRSTPVAATPKIVRVPAGDGASNKAGVLNVYSYVELNPTGTSIVELAAHFPKVNEIYVTSGMDGDHGQRPDGSYHYGHLTYNGSPAAAVDFGAYDMAGTAEGDRRMRDLARWFEDVMPGTASIVELIHTTPFADDDGFYVKNGQRASYDAATEAAHLNHVHLAMSQAQLSAALARLGTPQPVPSSVVIHTVVGGDTLTAIAAKYKTTVAAILKLNPSIKDPNVIYVGQRIQVK
ncbi:MAG TPA: LysM domain-containing protein [Streptosporangiaceae bacterium]